MPAAGSKSVSPGGWTDAEDAMLLRLVDVAGSNTWTTCARSLNKAFHNSNGNVRTGKQCRERWHNHLRPDIRTDPISKEEQMILIEAHKLHANKWTAIAGMLPHRTANQVKNYMNASLRMCQVVFQCTGIPAARKHIRKCLQHRCREMLEYVFNYLGSTQEVQENPNYMPLVTIIQLLNDSLTEMQSDSDHLASLGDARTNSPKRRNSGTLASPSSKRSRDGGAARDSAAGMSAAGAAGADFLNPAAALENSFNPAMAQFFAMQNLMYNPALFSQIAAMQASQMHAAGGAMGHQGNMPNTTESLASMLHGKGSGFGSAAGSGGQSAPDMIELLRSFPGFGGPGGGAGFPQFPMLPMQAWSQMAGQWNTDAMAALRAAMMPRMMGGMGQNMTPQAMAQLAGTNLMAGANAQMMEMLRAAGMQGGMAGANVSANMDKAFGAWGADDAAAQASQLDTAGAADDDDDEDEDEEDDEDAEDDGAQIKAEPPSNSANDDDDNDFLQQHRDAPQTNEAGTSALREAGLKGALGDADPAGAPSLHVPETFGALDDGEQTMAGALASLHALHAAGEHNFDAPSAALLEPPAGVPMGVPHHISAQAGAPSDDGDPAMPHAYHPPDADLQLKVGDQFDSQ